MRSGVILAALLSAAAAAEEPRFDAAAAFLSVLPSERARALSGQDDLGALASALTPEQRHAAGAKLRDAESRAKDPRDLAAIHKGFLALEDAEGAGRVGDSVVARFPQASAGYVMRGQAAELRGDMAAAVEQARQALRRDPRDPAAFALLKLSEGRGSSGASSSPRDASSALGEFDAAPARGASPESLDLMRQAVEARRAGDLGRVRSLALAAMRADPKSATAQDFYRLAEEDLRRASSARVGLYAELSRRQDDARAEREAAADLAAARRRHAPRRAPPIPPIAPIGAGGLLLTLGIMAWNRGLRDEAERRAHETARVAAAGLIVLGCAGVSYGAATLLLASAPAAGPPALALAGGGAAATAVPAAAPAAAGVAGAAIGAKALEHYSFASAPARRDDPDPYEKAKSGGRHSGSYENYKGRSTDELRRALRGYERQVESHQDKINNPSRYYRNWERMDRQEQEIALLKWFKDKERNQELADIMKGLLKERDP